jgi:hypothetical protein
MPLDANAIKQAAGLVAAIEQLQEQIALLQSGVDGKWRLSGAINFAKVDGSVQTVVVGELTPEHTLPLLQSAIALYQGQFAAAQATLAAVTG